MKNFYPYTFFLDYFGKNHEQFVDQLIEKISQVPNDAAVILWADEWITPDRVMYIIDKVGNRRKRVHWLFNDSYYPQYVKTLFNSTGIDIYWLEMGLLVLDFELSIFKTSILNSSWNPNAEKFLFLTGKPNRVNRIRLLHKFYSQGLLEKSIWSFFMDDLMFKQCRELLPELSDHNYQAFVTKNINNPDDAQILYNTAGTCHYDGYPFDANMYSNVAFRVISETRIGGQPINTEKTWVTIANKLPFMISGYRGNLELLRQQGFRTFENYLAVKNYDWIDDDESRLNAIVSNTEYLLKHIKSQEIEIAQDIEYNYKLLMEKIFKTRQIFKEIYDKLGPVPFDIFRILPIPMQRAQWVNFYYEVKDASWPDCWSPRDFHQLPNYIKTELIEVHGYVP
jgi:hypothetical protein